MTELEVPSMRWSHIGGMLVWDGRGMLEWLWVVAEATGLIHIAYQWLECFSAPQDVLE